MRWRGKGQAPARETALLGIFLACALVIGLIERMIPLGTAIPGIRLGLGNTAVLLAIYLFNFSGAFKVVLGKCLLSAMFAGSPTAFFYSVSGSLLSLFVMAALIRFFGKHISPVGVSIAGAAFHNTGQILAACALMGTWAALFYLPALLIAATVTGTLTGILARALLPQLTAFLRRNE